MLVTFVIAVVLFLSGCSVLPKTPPGAPETNDNPCFNRLFKSYGARMTSDRQHYRMINTIEGVQMCSVNLSVGTDAYLLYDPDTTTYWHDFTRPYEDQYDMKMMLERDYTLWQEKNKKEEVDKLCAADASCMAKKKRDEEYNQKLEAKNEKIWIERRHEQMKQCLPYAKDLSGKIPSLFNPRVENAFGNGTIIVCQVRFDKKTVSGTFLKMMSLTINTSNGAYEYQ